MSILSKQTLNSRLPLGAVAVVLSAATLLGGCVVRAVVPAPPPPPRVYVQPAPPPPPAYAQPAYSEPAVDVEVTANEAPPPLPDYEQPPCPEDGYMWTPGYWAWGGGGYYWVPGTWVQPPRVGVLWTPGYWGFVGGVYSFNVGYWGPHIGYYGGVNYGFGYVGVGFAGGRWVGNSFAYNQNRDERECDQCSQHVQRDGHQQCLRHQGELQRRTRRHRTRYPLRRSEPRVPNSTYLRRPRNTRMCKRRRAILP